MPQAPELPPEAIHVWNAFAMLSSARTSNGFGPNPITYAEIEAYNRLTGDGLTPWEVEAIRELDDAFLAIALESRPK